MYNPVHTQSRGVRCVPNSNNLQRRQPHPPSPFWMLGHLNIYPTAQWQSRLSTSIQVFQPENGSARHLHDNSKHSARISGEMKHIFMDTYVWAMIDVESRTIFREHRLRDTERASSSETMFLLKSY